MRRSSQGAMSMSYDAGSGGRGGLLACYASKAKQPRPPSKWDDAQRWLSSSSRAPDDDRRRSSCADDRTLLPSASQKGTRHSSSWGSDVAALALVLGAQPQDDAEATETKRVDAVLAYGQQRCLSLRDVGTEMTPGGSKEPSRANTPRATAPAPAAADRDARARRRKDGGPPTDRAAAGRDEGTDGEGPKEAAGAPTAAVSPATAWDVAERAKHMAR
ncbi:hypothetical protein EJB05_50956, partial [Eragrostis curvula]